MCSPLTVADSAGLTAAASQVDLAAAVREAEDSVAAVEAPADSSPVADKLAVGKPGVPKAVAHKAAAALNPAVRKPGGPAKLERAHIAVERLKDTLLRSQFPTDAGYGAPAAGGGSAAYANHRTQPTNANAMADNGAAVRNSYSGTGTFNKNWYAANPTAWHAAGWTGAEAWSSPSWAVVAPAVGGATAQPIPYNYGNNVTYQDNQVYSGDQPVASADQYYQQAASTAQSAPPADPQTSDWTPLGVFALVRDEHSTPRYVMQLAMNKSGALAGNYRDLITDSIQPVQGSVDKQSQRVAWTVGDNKTTVGEAGLYNLTQDEAPALIHIGQDKTQQWLLVRLKQPQK